MIDVASLSAALTTESPSGPDLESDPDFQALEWAARGSHGRGDGNEGPDWARVRQLAEALLQRTRDLRVDCLLTQALTATDGLKGLSDGIELLKATCTQLWDSVYPLLDADDGNDPTMRLNALQMIAHPDGLLQTLRRARWFTAPGIGPITVRTAEMVLGVLPWPEGTEPELTLEQLRGLLGTAAANGLEDHATRAMESVLELQRFIGEQVGAGHGADLGPLVNRLRPLSALYLQATAATQGAEATPGTSPGASPGATIGASPAVGRSGPIGTVSSKRDALDALDRVCIYLETHEPANPAPLLIRRAQKLMTMSFVDIVRDLAPEGMGSIAKIAGLADTES